MFQDEIDELPLRYSFIQLLYNMNKNMNNIHGQRSLNGSEGVSRFTGEV